MILRLSVCLVLALAAPGRGEEPNLADLRAELADLRGQVQALRSELVASGAEGYQAAGGVAAIDRMDAMERRLARLTDRTEQLGNTISSIVADTRRRMADLEFRLCEMDTTCDLSALTMNDGGGRAADLAPAAVPAEPRQAPGSAAERPDFAAARQVMAAGDFRRAAGMFGALATAHAGTALTAEALFQKGVALEGAGDRRAAGAAWLEGFAADPDGPRGAESLLNLSRVIAEEGDPTAACLYLAEIPARFPGTPFAAEAETRLSRLACAGRSLAEEELEPTGDPEARP